MQQIYLKKICCKEGFKHHNKHPFDLPLFQRGDFNLDFTNPLTIIVGENGSGKSTLLEAIAAHCGFALEGGSRNHHYQTDTHNHPAENLADQLTFSWQQKVFQGFFFRAESFYNFASHLDKNRQEYGNVVYQGYGGKLLHQQSHGESFLSFFSNRNMQQKALYILDEPESALSPQRQLSLMYQLHTLVQHGAQIIMASHSPLLCAIPKAQLLEIQQGQITPKPNYQQLAHYKIYKRFIEAPNTLLKPPFEPD